MKVIINKEEMQKAVIAFFNLPENSEVCLEDLYEQSLQQLREEYVKDHASLKKLVSEDLYDEVEAEPELKVETKPVKQVVRRRRRQNNVAVKKPEPIKEEIKEELAKEPETVIEPVQEAVAEVQVEVTKPEPVQEAKPVLGSLASKLFNNSVGLNNINTSPTNDEVNIADSFFIAEPKPIKPEENPFNSIPLYVPEFEEEIKDEDWNHPWLSKPAPKEILKPMTAEDIKRAQEYSPFRNLSKSDDEFKPDWVKEKLTKEEEAKSDNSHLMNMDVINKDKEEANTSIPKIPSFIPKEWA